jgi:murein DD-endopeptidase MepM/ murein hydrolase activator NlpD
VQTPGHRIPSHGTDQMGQRYAYDFLRIERERKGYKFFRGTMRQYLWAGTSLADCYGWSAPIHAPFDGSVVTARDGWPEREPVSFVRDLGHVLTAGVKIALTGAADLRALLGNHLILKAEGRELYALIAHARTGSVRVPDGAIIRTGQHIADVGHSGSSTAPHLHFQLMDKPDPRKAQGLPCSFREYEALEEGGGWNRVQGGIPKRRQFVRYVG